MNSAFQFGDYGVATVEVDRDNRRLVLTQRHFPTWHDGVPVTLRDLVFAYETMAHPDYMTAGGIRFSGPVRNVVGIMGFHNYLRAQADADWYEEWREENPDAPMAAHANYIEGLVLSADGLTLYMYFDPFPPELLYMGPWFTPMPEHIFRDIPIMDQPNSDAVRVNPIGWGPFMVEHIVAGESMMLTRNDNFVWGTPYIESMRVRRIDPVLVAESMVAGDFDRMIFPTAEFENYRNPTNFRYLGSRGGGYSYMSWRLGNWNFETNRNEFNPDRYMNQPGAVYLRRAMAHAANEQMLGQQLFNGLQFPAGSFMAPHHQDFMDLSVPALGYDPDLARQILDDAGFQVGANGYRTWPDGSDLTIVWAMGVSLNDEILHQFYTQAFSDIGVRVVLWRDQFHDPNYLFDVLDYDTDGDEIHLYMAQWTAGSNPNPQGRWGHAMWNPARWHSEEWDAILARLVSDEAWDPEYLMDAYSAMQWYMYNNVFFAPNRWNIVLTALNNRVAVWDTRVGIPPQEYGWHTIRLTAAQPYSG